MSLLQSSGIFSRMLQSSRRRGFKLCNKPAMAMGYCRRRFRSSIRAWVSRPLFQQVLGAPARTSIIRCFSSSPHSSYSFPQLDPSCFSPSLGSLVDISQYLMNGCNWKEAPPCPDYVGPVAICRTPDGRGRGLYASRDVVAGDILIISNAFAATYNDPDRIEMYFKIASILKESPKTLRLYYTLAGEDCQNDMEVPDAKLFEFQNASVDGDVGEGAEYDEKRVIHIMNVNSFAGDLNSSNGEPETRLTGLWLLPSFINHSCSPNAGRLVVGEAMFILASRDIQAEEEITISYTDSMSPLKRREGNLGEMGYGFLCKCRRCLLERSLQQELEEISGCYHSLYDEAVKEVYSAVTGEKPSSVNDCPACVDLASIFDSLVMKLNSLGHLTNLERQLVIGGYSCAFLGKWLVSGYATGFSAPSDFVTPTALEVVEAMKATEPGILRTLSFITLLATLAQNDMGRFASLVPSLLNLALDECIRIYGKQRLDVCVKLIEQSANIVPFF